MSIGVRVEGARQLRRTMRQAGIDVKEMSAVHRRISAIAAERAKTLAPVGKTGRLVSGIRGTGSAGKAAVRINRRAVIYGGVQEYGWGRRKIPAQRFIRRAVKETKAEWLELYHKEIEKIINKIEGTNVNVSD